jgi:hypothetical protein
MSLPPYVLRYCHWSPSIVKQQQVPIAHYRLQTQVKYAEQTLAQAEEFQGYLQQFATGLVSRCNEPASTLEQANLTATFIRLEVNLGVWSTVRLSFREDSSSLNRENWTFVAMAVAAAKNDVAKSLSVEVCERFETGQFDSILDIAPSDLIRIHEFL